MKQYTIIKDTKIPVAERHYILEKGDKIKVYAELDRSRLTFGFNEARNNSTKKCPICGHKYLSATGYCVSCKKKVKKEARRDRYETLQSLYRQNLQMVDIDETESQDFDESIIKALAESVKKKESEKISEGEGRLYLVYNNRGMRSSEYFNNDREAVAYVKRLGTDNWALFRNEGGFHSTADPKYLVAFGPGDSYWVSSAEKDPEIAKKLYTEREK